MPYCNSYSHPHFDSNSDVYPNCHSYGYRNCYSNHTAYTDCDGDAEAASDSEAATKHEAIKAMVDVLAAVAGEVGWQL